MSTLRIAWRNLWRNRTRTSITGAAIALNTAILIVTIGLTNGMLDAMLHNLTSMALGEAQVHAPQYRSEHKMEQVVKHPDAILAAADAAGLGAAARAYGPGLAAVASKSSGARYWGVDPARERRYFELARQLQAGRFLSDEVPVDEGGDPVREVVLGSKLASTLQAEVGSELVAVVQATDGSVGNDLFEVVGILKSISSDVDRSAAIVHQDTFRDLFVSDGRIHEVALTSQGRLPSDQVVAAVKKAAGSDEVLTWQELAPAPAQMAEMFASMMGLFGIIFGLTAGAGVMNTMLMSTFDRIREFGVLKALGATPWRIVRDVAAEALLLGVGFAVLGAALGLAGGTYLTVVGLDLATGDDLMLSGVAFDSIWRAKLTTSGILESMAFMVFVSVLAALYPAWKAARLDPVVAMSEP